VPELPEVERAVVQLRRHLVGRRIAPLALHHPALRRRLTTRQRRSLAGIRVVAVRRRGKHQLIDLEDGRVLHAHFRMTGDWMSGAAATRSRYPRATITLDDGTIVVLDDPRALSTLAIDAAGIDSLADIGPDADDPTLTAAWLAGRLWSRRVAIKVVLLDQAVMSGIGNIYAAESLWRARIDPRRPAGSLTGKEVGVLLRSIRAVLRRATGARYTDRGARFDVYDREGKRCRRCGETIERIVQAGRSTYFCANCQG
jgi:formamidopyrimidine-DNA glycosylase